MFYWLNLTVFTTVVLLQVNSLYSKKDEPRYPFPHYIDIKDERNRVPKFDYVTVNSAIQTSYDAIPEIPVTFNPEDGYYQNDKNCHTPTLSIPLLNYYKATVTLCLNKMGMERGIFAPGASVKINGVGQDPNALWKKVHPVTGYIKNEMGSVVTGYVINDHFYGSVRVYDKIRRYHLLFYVEPVRNAEFYKPGEKPTGAGNAILFEYVPHEDIVTPDESITTTEQTFATSEQFSTPGQDETTVISTEQLSTLKDETTVISTEQLSTLKDETTVISTEQLSTLKDETTVMSTEQLSTLKDETTVISTEQLSTLKDETTVMSTEQLSTLKDETTVISTEQLSTLKDETTVMSTEQLSTLKDETTVISTEQLSTLKDETTVISTEQLSTLKDETTVISTEQLSTLKDETTVISTEQLSTLKDETTVISTEQLSTLKDETTVMSTEQLSTLKDETTVISTEQLSTLKGETTVMSTEQLSTLKDETTVISTEQRTTWKDETTIQSTEMLTTEPSTPDYTSTPAFSTPSQDDTTFGSSMQVTTEPSTPDYTSTPEFSTPSQDETFGSSMQVTTEPSTPDYTSTQEYSTSDPNDKNKAGGLKRSKRSKDYETFIDDYSDENFVYDTVDVVEELPLKEKGGPKPAPRKLEPDLRKYFHCPLCIWIQPNFGDKFGLSGGIEQAVGEIIDLVRMMNWFFRAQDFDEDGLPEGVGFAIRQIIVSDEIRVSAQATSNSTTVPGSTGNSTGSASAPGAKSSEEITRVTTKAAILSISQHFKKHFSGCCVSLGFMYHNMAPEFSASNFRGLCTDKSVGLLSGYLHGHKIGKYDLYRGMIHIVGHLFGSKHDVVSWTECKDSKIYRFLNPFPLHPIQQINVGIRPNSFRYSQCSREQISHYLNVNRPPCIVSDVAVVRTFCGNGIKEEGEECDCGTLRQCHLQKQCCGEKDSILGCKLLRKQYSCPSPTSW